MTTPLRVPISPTVWNAAASHLIEDQSDPLGTHDLTLTSYRQLEEIRAGRMEPNVFETIRESEAGQAEALPRLLDLGADKCVPCKMMAPILDEMKAEFAGVMTVEFVDVWKNPAAAEPYGIKLIPTQIFFAPDGTELFRHEGFYSREDILAKWAELGYELPGREA